MNPNDIREIAGLLHILHFFLIVAAICATIFPIVYAKGGRWYRSTLGRVLMLHGVALALAIDLTTLFTYWKSADLKVRVWIDIGVIALVAFATMALLYLLIKTQYSSVVSPPKTKYDGTVVVEQKEGKKIFHLEVDGDLDTLDQQDELVFRVRTPDTLEK